MVCNKLLSYGSGNLFFIKILIIICISAIIAMKTKAGPILKDKDLTTYPPQADELFKQCVAGKELPQILKIHFRTYAVGSQLFAKRFRSKVTPETLVFSIPQRKEKDKISISCIIYKWLDGRESGLLSFELIFDGDDQTLAALEELYALRSLNAYVSFYGLKYEKEDKKETPSFKFSVTKAEVAFTDSDKELLKVSCNILPFSSFPKEEKALSNSAKSLSIKFELEDLPNIRYFFDWEPEYSSWYAREYHWDAAGKGLVVCQEKAKNKVWNTKLPESIPPGRYNVLINPSVVRHQIGPSILNITLNGCKREYIWWAGGNWKTGPVFETKKSGDELIIEAVEIGAAGDRCHPSLIQQKIILLDNIAITTDLNTKESEAIQYSQELPDFNITN